ncbi:scarecrow-like protein 9 [Miscanthus floridulus]|uniref:scarecrow-like protein 9 n=1 Tax=Miscanthus floridulus TaxID=154761 RepID=UPI00345A5BC9
MAAEPEDIPDEEPFSPSIFLNLSPTPPHPGDEQDPAAASSSNSYHQAPQTSTEILSILSDPCVANTIDVGVGTCFPDTAPVWDGVTWPYDPVELSQKLLSSTTTPPYPNSIGRDGGLTMGDADAASLLATPASASDVGEHDALFSSGGAGETAAARNRITMDMLNQAFLKGMEEANKFLPTNNTLLIHLELETISESGDRHGLAAGQKRHNRDDNNLEVEAGRKSKVVAPEPEETGEMVDRFILVGYQSLLDKMMDMSIAVDSEAEQKSRKGKKKSTTPMAASSSKEEVVDLRALLLQCAHAVATGNRLGATELLCKIKQHSSPTGDATQRLAYCFARALDARLAGTGSQLYRSLMVKHTSAMEFIKAYQMYLAVSCFKMMAFKFSNLTICKAVAGRRKKLHIVDYGEHYGFHWPTLLGFWGTQTWDEGPPEVRITFVGLPEPGFRPAARIEETGRRLSTFARQCGIPFRFRSIAAKWETVCADDLGIEPDELLVVNGLFHFGRLMDEGIDGIYTPSPRDVLLGNIRKMRPHVFILCVENSLHNAPYFLGRFQEALFYYSSMFDMMDAAAPRDNEQRLLVEQDLFGRRVLNAVACEGFDRVERPETYKQWQARNDRAGLRQLPLDPDIVKAVSEKVRDNYHRDFVIYVDKKWLLQGWKGRTLYAMSTWVANDGISDPS